MMKLCKPLVFSLVAAILAPMASANAEILAYDGLIEPYEVIEIGAPAEGIVAIVNVDRSSEVEKDQVLVQLESAVEHAALEKAKAMAIAKGEIDLQKTQLAYTKRVHERIKKLKAISRQDKDEAATEIVLTRHRLAKARENKTLARLELNKALVRLDQRRIKSPISGVVVERFVSPGEYVNNQPLMRVAKIDPLRVEVIVPSGMFGKIVPGMTATIEPELTEYGTRTAKVTIVDKVIDSASSTFGVRLELPNPGLQIPSGLRCTVHFDTITAALGTHSATARLERD